MEGYVIIHPAKSFLCSSAFSLKSATSISPFSADWTGITFQPTICALAGLVPWAEVGIKQTFLCSSPLALWYSAIVNNPAYSPCAPELGCMEIAS